MTKGKFTEAMIEEAVNQNSIHGAVAIVKVHNEGFTKGYLSACSMVIGCYLLGKIIFKK